jgi:hypothetical protein
VVVVHPRLLVELIMRYFKINTLNNNRLRTPFAGGVESLELEGKLRLIVCTNFKPQTSNFKLQTSN